MIYKPNAKMAAVRRPLARAFVEEVYLSDFADVLLMVMETVALPESRNGNKLRAATRLIHSRLHAKGLDDRSVGAAYDSWKRRRELYGSSWADDRWYHPDRRGRAHRLPMDQTLEALADRRIMRRDVA